MNENMPIVRNRFSPRDSSSDIDNQEPSLTKQSFQEECDINNIMKRYETKGILPEPYHREGIYGDFSDMASYHEAMNIVEHAKNTFAALPARIRDRFDNDPGKFLGFCEDPGNIDELVEMGLATRGPEPAVEGAQPPQKEPAGG